MNQQELTPEEIELNIKLNHDYQIARYKHWARIWGKPVVVFEEEGK